MRCGISTKEYWSLTPREALAAIEAYQSCRERERRRDLWLAWHVAALTRAKRLPSLTRLLQPKDAKVLEGEELGRRQQERDELLSRMDVNKINTQLRGTNAN